MLGVNSPGFANRNRFGLPSQNMSAAGANDMYMQGLGGGIGGGSQTGALSTAIRNSMRPSGGGNRPQAKIRSYGGTAGKTQGGQMQTGQSGQAGPGVVSTSSIDVKGVYSPSQLQGMQNTAKNTAIQQAANSAKAALTQAGTRFGAGSATNAALKNQAGLFGLMSGQRAAQDALMRGTEANAGHELQREGLRSQENLAAWNLADSAKNREAQLEMARQNQQLQTLGALMSMFGGMV